MQPGPDKEADLCRVAPSCAVTRWFCSPETQWWRSRGQLFQTGSVYHIFPLRPFLKPTLETDGGADHFPFGLVNKSRRSRITAKLGLSRLFHKRAKHRLRRHRSFGTDRFAPRGADRVQDKSSYETSFPGFARLPAHRACQPAANQSSVSPAGGAPAACCPAWMLTAGFLTHIFIQQHLWCEVGPRVPPHLSTAAWLAG